MKSHGCLVLQNHIGVIVSVVAWLVVASCAPDISAG